MSDKVEKVKKRKRNTDVSSKPSKRVAIDDDKQVKVLVTDTGKWAPVIASTPGLAIPTSVYLQPYTKARANASLKASHISASELLLHSSEHPKLDYTAREEEAGGTDALLRHYVGVYDPETGKMEVMEARKMVVRGSVRAHQATVEEQVSRDMRERRNVLGQTFGTKKARKAIASVTENAISDKSARRANGDMPMKLDSAQAAVIANIGQNTKNMATKDELAQQIEDGKPRPKANKDAKHVQDVYTIDSLIGTEIMKLIPVKQWQDSVNTKKEIALTSRFVASRIQKWSANVEKLKMMRYMLLMLEVLNACRLNRGIRALPKREELKKLLVDMPEAVLENIKRRFTGGNEISKFQADLIITHLCAMACVVENYEVDTYDLKEDLKLENKEMGQYFGEIGAKIANLGEIERKRLGLEKAAAAQRKVAKLKLPLVFPKIAAYGRSR